MNIVFITSFFFTCWPINIKGECKLLGKMWCYIIYTFLSMSAFYMLDVSHTYVRILHKDSPPLEVGKQYWELRDSIVNCELLLIRMLKYNPKVLFHWRKQSSGMHSCISRMTLSYNNRFSIKSYEWCPYKAALLRYVQ